MQKQIIIKDKENWDEIIDSFPNRDVYFTYDYFKPFKLNGDGSPYLYYFECEEGRVAYPFMLRDISDTDDFSEILEKDKYFDITSAYGYGGPLYDKIIGKNNLEGKFQEQFTKFCKEKDIISQFDRFHPLIENHKLFKGYSELLPIRKTVHINLIDEDTIWKNIDSKCRNKIRKAKRNNVKVVVKDNLETICKFIDIYNTTMKRNDASTYYFFNNNFFQETIKALGNKVMMVNAYYENEIIASSLIMKDNKYLHYHFSGANPKYRNLQANNLLLWEVSKWGSQNGYEEFHLGGGYESDTDSLYKFKKSFSKLADLDFYIGKKIHDVDNYNYLQDIWNKANKDKDENTFFPAYRSR